MAKPPKMNLSQFTGVMQAAAKVAPDAEIDIELIDIERQVRTKIGDLTELAASIKVDGVLEPIILLLKPDGRYRLIAGERRLRGSMLAGLTKIPATIKRDLTETQIRRIQVTENNEREDLSPYDEAMGVAEDVAKFGFKEAMAIWNRSESWVSKRTAVEKYAAPVLQVLNDGLCGDLEVLHSLNQLIAVSEKEYEALVDRMRAGVTVSRDDARNKVSAAKTWKKQSDALAQARANPGLSLAGGDDEGNASARQADDAEDEQETGTVAAEAAAPAAAGAKVKPEPAKAAPSKGKAKPQDKKGTQGELSGLDKSGDRQLADDREKARQKLHIARSEINDWGQSNRGMFNSMQENMSTLGFDLAQGEWALWTAFQDMVLPMMEALGTDRSMAYLKKLQGDLKGRSPMELWRELHPAEEGEDEADENAKRVAVVPMPKGWTF